MVKRNDPRLSPPLRPSRREALKYGLAAISIPLISPRACMSAAVQQKVRVAAVGVGNMGWGDLTSIASSPRVQVAALCDVDSTFLGKASKEFPSAATFQDYRRMLGELDKSIDAVVISTPDHMHGSIALAAMSLGKHAYVQKPLAHNLAELRAMCVAADESGVVTQMGTQIHGHEAYRTAVKMLRDGAIGKVHESHSWISRSLPLPLTSRPSEIAGKMPSTLDWNLWQGVAVEQSYAEGLYHPFNWRMWRDYGCGMLGDMAAHLFDPIFTGLELKAPLEVTSFGPAHSKETFAADTHVEYKFAPTPYTGETFFSRWTNGSFKPDVAKAQLPAGVELPSAGSFLVGDKGVMVLPHWAMPTCYSTGRPLEFEMKSAGNVNHYHEWVDACAGEGSTSTPFSYSGPLTEAVLLGTVAGAFPEKRLVWHSAALTFGDDGADALITREYREGWKPAQV